MTAVRRWSGREARALRLALRLSVRSFAEQLGVATRTVSKWESGGAATVPRPDTQAILDTALARTDAAARERFALLCLPDERPTGSAERSRLPVRSAEHVDEILVPLQEQWHALVRTDNLLGPRFALPAVLDHIAIIEQLLHVTSGEHRRALVALAATYAESAAWLHEDAGQMPAAGHWVGRAIEWSHEAGDRRLLAWTLFRRSQHAAYERDGQRTLGLARAAGRDADELPLPMRAAILQQEAHGHALNGDELMAHHTLDHALQWAADDTAGDARGGHGSFCTAAYLEMQRATCWSALGCPDHAISHFEVVLPTLPPVYHRDRGVGFGRLAHAYAATGDAEAAADRGRQALAIARSSGSVRTEQTVVHLGRRLTDHHRLAPVRLLLEELGAVA